MKNKKMSRMRQHTAQKQKIFYIVQSLARGKEESNAFSEVRQKLSA